MDSHMWETAQKFTAVIAEAEVLSAVGMETWPVNMSPVHWNKEVWERSCLCQYLAICD